MIHLEIGQSEFIKVDSELIYGGDIILHVLEGESYSFNADENQQWVDAFVKTDVNGFFNPLFLLSGKRLKGVKCFVLCGTIGLNEKNHFRIGASLENFEMPASGELYFFPNDNLCHYDNNKGSVLVKVTRES